MKMKILEVEPWSVHLQDRPGAMATKLEILAKAGANLEFIHARRTPEVFGKGILSIWPLKGAKQVNAAQKAGFTQAHGPVVLRLEHPDRPGLSAKVCHAMSEAGVNVRTFTGMDIAKKWQAYVTFDNRKDADKALQILQDLK